MIPVFPPHGDSGFNTACDVELGSRKRSQLWVLVLVWDLGLLLWLSWTLALIKKQESYLPCLPHGWYLSSQSLVSDSLWLRGVYLARLLCPWNFSRQEYWSKLPFPPSGGSSWPSNSIHVSCVTWIAGGFFTTEPPGKPHRQWALDNMNYKALRVN